MTAEADFTPRNGRVVLEGPPSAGMIVVTAQRGGTLRETIAMAKAYGAAAAWSSCKIASNEAASPRRHHVGAPPGPTRTCGRYSLAGQRGWARGELNPHPVARTGS